MVVTSKRRGISNLRVGVSSRKSFEVPKLLRSEKRNKGVGTLRTLTNDETHQRW